MRPWSVINIWLPGDILTLPPPPSLQTCSEIGEERDDFSPVRRNKPPKGSMSQVGFFFLIIYYIQSIYVMYICTHLISGTVGGSAELPRSVYAGDKFGGIWLL